LLTHGIENLRSLITELRPAALDELGPEPAVRALAERVRTQSGLEIELESQLAYEQGRASQRHSPDIEVAIYRIVQEALTNVVKHAGARHVWISITDPEDDDGPVCVEVRDDGHGFESARADGGFGLVGMRERIALVHGELEVTAAPGEGTRIVARIPLQRRPAGAAPPATPAT